MGTVTKNGVCPKCGSLDTDIVLKRRPKPIGGLEGVTYEARGICRSCGFEDMRLRGEDADIVTEIARKSFSTVYVGDSNADGLPTIQQLSKDISTLIGIICVGHNDCYACPMHQTDAKAEYVSDEGYFVQNSEIGLTCRCQYPDSCEKTIRQQYPGLPDGF